jgi:hypothetical protein
MFCKVGKIICLLLDLPCISKELSRALTTRIKLLRRRLTPHCRIYIAPNADDLPSWIASMQHIAKEGRCFVISVNQFCKVSGLSVNHFEIMNSHV